MVKNVLEKYSVSMMWELIFCEKSIYCMAIVKTKMGTGLRGSSEFLNKEKLQGFKLSSLVYNYTEVLK